AARTAALARRRQRADRALRAQPRAGDRNARGDRPEKLRHLRLRAEPCRMSARGRLVLVLVLLAGCASGGPGGRAAVSRRPRRDVLPNGVVLIAQEHRASDVVALQLWMRVGGRDETADELGLSHYLEHMLFKGTPTRPPGSIDALIEGLGGTSNAFT